MKLGTHDINCWLRTQKERKWKRCKNQKFFLFQFSFFFSLSRKIDTFGIYRFQFLLLHYKCTWEKFKHEIFQLWILTCWTKQKLFLDQINNAFGPSKHNKIQVSSIISVTLFYLPNNMIFGQTILYASSNNQSLKTRTNDVCLFYFLICLPNFLSPIIVLVCSSFIFCLVKKKNIFNKQIMTAGTLGVCLLGPKITTLAICLFAFFHYLICRTIVLAVSINIDYLVKQSIIQRRNTWRLCYSLVEQYRLFGQKVFFPWSKNIDCNVQQTNIKRGQTLFCLLWYFVCFDSLVKNIVYFVQQYSLSNMERGNTLRSFVCLVCFLCLVQRYCLVGPLVLIALSNNTQYNNRTIKLRYIMILVVGYHRKTYPSW